MEIEDGKENERRDERNRVEDKMWMFRIEKEIISNKKKEEIKEIEKKREENRKLEKDKVKEIRRNECECDRNIEMMVIESEMKCS